MQIGSKTLLNSTLSHHVCHILWETVMEYKNMYMLAVQCWVTLEITLIFGICAIFYYIPGETTGTVTFLTCNSHRLYG